MIPRAEIDALILTAQDAADLALAGEPADGYQALLGGLARAREFEGEPWAEVLVRHRSDGVDEACVDRRSGRFEVRMDAGEASTT